ncbi:hypothetical protein KEM48_006110 [Puccinia striiformis f. sp. tritici PST-130]|nr:hypothetical protein KEM48_006110 [Puccinia striiformis f. sp. tritici PST-130]
MVVRPGDTNSTRPLSVRSTALESSPSKLKIFQNAKQASEQITNIQAIYIFTIDDHCDLIAVLQVCQRPLEALDSKPRYQSLALRYRDDRRHSTDPKDPIHRHPRPIASASCPTTNFGRPLLRRTDSSFPIITSACFQVGTASLAMPEDHRLLDQSDLLIREHARRPAHTFLRWVEPAHKAARPFSITARLHWPAALDPANQGRVCADIRVETTVHIQLNQIDS